jgi:hypothetical protein
MVSRRDSTDIHPAYRMRQEIYLCSSARVVIEETATVANDVSILHGVTWKGTGRESAIDIPKSGMVNWTIGHHRFNKYGGGFGCDRKSQSHCFLMLFTGRRVSSK